MTRVVPLVALSDLSESLGFDDLRGGKLHDFVEQGVAKILRFQTESGQFALWPGCEPESDLTAFALYALALAKDGGYAVPTEPVERGLLGLRAGILAGHQPHSFHHPMGEAGSRAFALYVLAVWKRPEPALMARLYADRGELPRYGKAFLARALARGGGDADKLRQLVKEMTMGAVPKGDGLLLPEPAGGELAYYMSDDVRSTALVLQALLEADPGQPMVEKLARGLLAARQSGRWDTTEDNFYGLVGLAAFARQKARAESPVEIRLADRTLFDGAAQARAPRRLEVPLEKAQGALRIRARGRPVYYAARLRYAPEPAAVHPAARGFEIRREILDPETGAKVSRLRVGQTVRVRLTVLLPESRTRVALVDRLPAGLEVLDARTARERGGGNAGAESDWRWRWNHVESHDDRVEAFSDWLPAGTQSFDYLARATVAGHFAHPPATVEEMYRPQHFARTAYEQAEVAP